MTKNLGPTRKRAGMNLTPFVLIGFSAVLGAVLGSVLIGLAVGLGIVLFAHVVT